MTEGLSSWEQNDVTDNRDDLLPVGQVDDENPETSSDGSKLVKSVGPLAVYPFAAGWMVDSPFSPAFGAGWLSLTLAEVGTRYEEGTLSFSWLVERGFRDLALLSIANDRFRSVMGENVVGPSFIYLLNRVAEVAGPIGSYIEQVAEKVTDNPELVMYSIMSIYTARVVAKGIGLVRSLEPGRGEIGSRRGGRSEEESGLRAILSHGILHILIEGGIKIGDKFKEMRGRDGVMGTAEAVMVGAEGMETFNEDTEIGRHEEDTRGNESLQFDTRFG